MARFRPEWDLKKGEQPILLSDLPSEDLKGTFYSLFDEAYFVPTRVVVTLNKPLPISVSALKKRLLCIPFLQRQLMKRYFVGRS